MAFDNHRLVTNAKLILRVVLALGLDELVNKHLDKGTVVMADAIIRSPAGSLGRRTPRMPSPSVSGLATVGSPTT